MKYTKIPVYCGHQEERQHQNLIKYLFSANTFSVFGKYDNIGKWPTNSHILLCPAADVLCADKISIKRLHDLLAY